MVKGAIVSGRCRALFALVAFVAALLLCALQPNCALAVSEGWQETGTCEWQQEGSSLFIRPVDNGAAGTLPEWGSESEAPWAHVQASVKNVKVYAGVSATSCAYLFAGLSNAKAFDLIGLDTSAAANFTGMFYGCTNMTKTCLEDLDFSNATTFANMMSGCTALVSADLSCVKAPKLSVMSRVFYNCADLQKVTLKGIETGTLTDLSGMFWGCGKLQSVDIQVFDTSKVTTFSHLFASCSSLRRIDAASIDTTSATTLDYMFQSCRSLTRLDVAGWNTKSVKSLLYTFAECDGLKTIEFSKWDLSNLVTAKMMFEADNHLEKVDLTPFRKAHKLEDVYAMFNQCVSLKSVNLRCMDFSHLAAMGSAHFMDGCESIKSIDLSGKSFGGCVDPEQMFSGCKNLVSVNLKNARFEEGVTFAELFTSCEKLKSVDMTNLYAPRLTQMNAMFANCKSLQDLKLKGATFGTIAAANNAFKNCSSLKSLDLSGIVSSKKKFTQIFYGCYADSYKPMQGFTAEGPKSHPSIASATCAKLSNVKYDGKYKTPAVKLSVPNKASYVWGDLWGKNLVQGRHYTVSYSNNRKIGTATVTIKGMGIFKGSVKKTFKILPK